MKNTLLISSNIRRLSSTGRNKRLVLLRQSFSVQATILCNIIFKKISNTTFCIRTRLIRNILVYKHTTDFQWEAWAYYLTSLELVGVIISTSTFLYLKFISAEDFV